MSEILKTFIATELLSDFLPDGEGGSAPTKAKLTAEARGEIKRAQARLRRAPDFVKNVAKSQGIERISLRGNKSELAISLNNARLVNSSLLFSKREYNKWKKDLSEDTRLSMQQIDFALSQIDAQKMDYLQNSKLRYGSNPQLDYILDSATEVAGRYQLALEDLQKAQENIELDIF